VAIDALQHAITNVHIDPSRKKRKEMHNATYGRQNVLEIALRILEECRGRHHTSAASSSTEPRRSTLWTADLQRVAGPSDIMRGMCPCAAGSKFPKWLFYECGIGHFIVSRNTVFMSANEIIPAILHNLKFQILSQCRTQPIDMPNIMRGVIDKTELGTLRVAGTAAAFMSHAQAPSLTSEAWDSTDKHKVLWMVPTRCLQEAAGIVKGSKGSTGGKGSNVGKGSTGSKGSKVSKGGTQVEDPQLAERLWRCGSLHIAVSAPRTAYGKWRLKFEPPVSSDFAGQVTCFTLEWVGNKVFHHECLRRAGNASDPFIGPLIHWMMPFNFQQESTMHGAIHQENIGEHEELRITS